MAAIVSLRQLIDAFDAAFNPSDLTNFYGNDWLDVRNAIELSVTGINTAEVQIGGTTRLTDAGGASLSECLPDTNLTRSLGTAGLQWKELFAQTIYGAGTGLTGVLLLSGGTMAGNISMAGNSITNLPAIPTDSTEAVPKSYVDAFAAGLKVKTQCRVATAVELIGTRATNTITADANGSINAAGIDGITTLAIGDSVLMKNQGDAAKSKTDQGIYQITDLGSAGTPWVMVRRADADSSADVMHGMYTFIVEGTANGNKGYYLTTDDPIVLNTTALDFTIYVGVEDITASSPLQRVGNDLQLTGTVPVGNGGTGLTTFASGSLPYASALDTLSALAAGTNGHVLTMVGGFPSWAAAGLPGLHASTHEAAGADEIDLGGLTATAANIDLNGNDLVDVGNISSNVSALLVQRSSTGKTQLKVQGNGANDADMFTTYGNDVNAYLQWSQKSTSTWFDFGSSVGACYWNTMKADVDFIVRGLTDNNLLYVNAGIDSVGVGGVPAGGKLSVVGSSDTPQLRCYSHTSQGNPLVLLYDTAGGSALGFYTGSTSQGRISALNRNLELFAPATYGIRFVRSTGATGAFMDASTGNFQFNNNIGFYGTAPVVKPTVTGSRGGNAALASLLTALASQGLLTDSTTV